MKNARFTMQKRLFMVVLTAVIAGGAGMNSIAAEIKPGTESMAVENIAAKNIAAENAAAENTAAESTAAESTVAESTVTESPVHREEVSTGTNNAGSDDNKEDKERSAEGYEIYLKDENNSKGSLRKGDSAKIVVSVRAVGIKTNEVPKSSIEVSKLRDSFNSSGSKPRIKVTSGKNENLEFEVTFSKLTYRGRGDELRFRVRYKKEGIPSEIVTASIAECEEPSASDSDNGDVVTGQPVIKIKRSSPQNPVRPGEAFSLDLEVENTSRDSDIEDLVVSVNPGPSLFIAEDTNSRMIRYLNRRKSAQIQLNMTAGKELTGPSQTLELELKYNYYSGNRLVSATSSQKVLLPVIAGAGSGQPVIRVSRSPGGSPIHAGQIFEVGIHLENTEKEREIRNLTAVFEPGDQLALIGQTDTQNLGTLAPGQAVDFTVKLQAGQKLSGTASQLIGLNLKFDYDSDKGPVQGSYGEKIVVPIKGELEKPSSPTPSVIIQNYTYGGMVAAGQVFDLNLEFCNTSSQQTVENLVISLETGEGISINSASNTFYLPKLGANEIRKETVKVQALFQSKLQSPKITISSKYEYIDNNERKQSVSTETIAIPVYQPDRFELKEAVISENMRENEEGTISIPYINKGRGQIFNVEAKLEGEMKALEKELALGNFDSGKSGTLDFVVTPQHAGTFELKVLVSYEDEAMQAKTLTVPVTTVVMEEQAGKDEFEESMAEPVGKPPWRKPLAVFSGVSLAGICAVLFLKWRKAATGGAEDEINDWDSEDDGEREDDREGEDDRDEEAAGAFDVSMESDKEEGGL